MQALLLWPIIVYAFKNLLVQRGSCVDCHSKDEQLVEVRRQVAVKQQALAQAEKALSDTQQALANNQRELRETQQALDQKTSENAALRLQAADNEQVVKQLQEALLKQSKPVQGATTTTEHMAGMSIKRLFRVYFISHLGLLTPVRRDISLVIAYNITNITHIGVITSNGQSDFRILSGSSINHKQH